MKRSRDDWKKQAADTRRYVRMQERLPDLRNQLWGIGITARPVQLDLFGPDARATAKKDDDDGKR